MFLLRVGLTPKQRMHLLQTAQSSLLVQMTAVDAEARALWNVFLMVRCHQGDYHSEVLKLHMEIITHWQP